MREVASDVRSFGAYALTNEFEYKDEGIPFLRGTNFAGNFINFADVLRISPDAHELLHKSEVTPGMVLLSMSGSVGSVAVALDSWHYPINSNQDIAKIIPHTICPFYLASFLSSSFGQIQVNRLPVGSIQQHIFLWMIERIQVPRFSSQLEKRIGALAKAAYEANEAVSHFFCKAEEALLAALGLADWTPLELLSYTARASDVFAAGRWDAQYFRPLFEEVEQRLLATGGAVKLGTILEINSRGRQPNYDTDGLPVINSKHVRTNKVLLGDDNRRAIEAGSPVVIKKGDVLVNGTGVGTIGRTAAFLHEQKALPDNHVTVLRTSRVDPIYLAVFLNSLLGQLQIERHIKGSSGQIELYPNDIAKIVFWDAPDHVQASVRHAVLSAFKQERCAHDLLEAAKHAVEIAIEDGEATALGFLDAVEGAA
ncbi:hypothetical protein [Paracoccus haematequi]|uniref:restriction endonuclease subunit S n=1 Tax=Paracoccus haematequi TaxID=2491866 RepID=UPI0019D12F38|nr:hypothetical protein [Paracoccus haematequi]